MKKSDSSTRMVMWAVAAAAALLVVGGLGVVVLESLQRKEPEPPLSVLPTPEALSQFDLVFEPGSEKLPRSGLSVIEAVVNRTTDASAQGIEITAFHPEEAENALALQRAASVRHALEAQGVSGTLIQSVHVKPTKSRSAKPVDRVEITVYGSNN